MISDGKMKFFAKILIRLIFQQLQKHLQNLLNFMK